MPQLGRPVCAVQQADYEFQTLWWQDKQAANTNAMTKEWKDGLFPSSSVRQVSSCTTLGVLAA